MVQALNTGNDGEPSITPCKNTDCFHETSVYEDSYSLEHRPDDTEYMVPSRKKY